MKIIHFQAMPNDECWQGATLCLGDDGVIYLETTNRKGHRILEPYITPEMLKEQTND